MTLNSCIYLCIFTKTVVIQNPMPQTDGQTDGLTDGQTDGQTDWGTDRLKDTLLYIERVRCDLKETHYCCQTSR